MENILQENAPIGEYKTYDKIKNFKIRVKVRKIANSCFSGKDSIVFDNPDELELVDMMKASSVATERTFYWQEKVSKGEQSGGDSHSQKGDPLHVHLFSYTDVDKLATQFQKFSCTQPASGPSHLEKQASQMRHRRKTQLFDRDTWQRPLIPLEKNVLREKHNTKENPLPSSQQMLISAALKYEDSSKNEEMLLCSLQLDEHNTLTMIPDFTRTGPYTFANSRSETFEYELENVSTALTESASNREKYLIKRIDQYKTKLKRNYLEQEISVILPDVTTFSFNCEIVSAENFSQPDNFIHYWTQIPKGIFQWSCNFHVYFKGYKTADPVEGTTETCRSKSKDNTKIAYFGYPFSMDLTEEKDASASDVKVRTIFEVTSVDYWGNFRSEGYCFTDFPLQAGFYEIRCCCWKLRPVSLRDRLQNFFIGGMPNLDDLGYVIGMESGKESRLCKYGVQTEPSGSILLRVSVIQQSGKAML